MPRSPVLLGLMEGSVRFFMLCTIKKDQPSETYKLCKTSLIWMNQNLLEKKVSNFLYDILNMSCAINSYHQLTLTKSITGINCFSPW